MYNIRIFAAGFQTGDHLSLSSVPHAITITTYTNFHELYLCTLNRASQSFQTILKDCKLSLSNVKDG